MNCLCDLFDDNCTLWVIVIALIIIFCCCDSGKHCGRPCGC